MIAAVNSVLRILDANANRAREALRVMEDAARFALDDANLTEQLKQLRHDLVAVLKRFDGLEFHRDTPGDIGTSISTDAERTRISIADVVIAAGKRLGEAMRTLEEYAKLIDSNAASRIEQLRYRAYDIEHRMHIRLASGRAKQWRVCVIITESLCTHHSWLDVARISIEAGAECIQLREKTPTDSELLGRAGQLVKMAQGRAAVIINDRVDIALAASADGVHLGEHDLSISEARQLSGRRLIIGASTHNLDEAARAVEAGADYCGVGAMFASRVKPDRIPSGPAYLEKFIERFPNTPHLAIGGITPDNISELVKIGCLGVAVSNCVCGASDPGDVVANLHQALERASRLETEIHTSLPRSPRTQRSLR
jgi:thiamine-phosphate pyrophosphorylase